MSEFLVLDDRVLDDSTSQGHNIYQSLLPQKHCRICETCSITANSFQAKENLSSSREIPSWRMTDSCRCLNPFLKSPQKEIYCPGCQLWVVQEQAIPDLSSSQKATQSKVVTDATQIGQRVDLENSKEDKSQPKTNRTNDNLGTKLQPDNNRNTASNTVNAQLKPNQVSQNQLAGSQTTQVSQSIMEAQNAVQVKLDQVTISIS